MKQTFTKMIREQKTIKFLYKITNGLSNSIKGASNPTNRIE